MVITIGGHTWRSRVASMGGRFIVGISAADRTASGISEGDVTEVDLRLDDEPRMVAEPPDLAAALNQDPRARAAFDQLPYGLKNKHVRDIEGAKSPETRQRRIAKLVTTMSSGQDAQPSGGMAPTTPESPLDQAEHTGEEHDHGKLGLAWQAD